MRYLKKFNSEKELQDRIQLLKYLSMDLIDSGYKINIEPKSRKFEIPYEIPFLKKDILLHVIGKSNNPSVSQPYVHSNIKFNNPDIIDFEKTLKSYGIKYVFRQKSFNGIYYSFDCDFKIDNNLI